MRIWAARLTCSCHQGRDQARPVLQRPKAGHRRKRDFCPSVVGFADPDSPRSLRGLQAVTEPQRDEERDPQIWALDRPEERHTQSRQHDYFACEGPGLASMLRSLGSGIRMPLPREEEEDRGGWASAFGLNASGRAKRRRVKPTPDVRSFSRLWPAVLLFPPRVLLTFSIVNSSAHLRACTCTRRRRSRDIASRITSGMRYDREDKQDPSCGAERDLIRTTIGSLAKNL